MVERRQHLSFALEPGQAVWIAGELLREDLEGDVTIQFRVARAIDLAIPPAPSGARIS